MGVVAAGPTATIRPPAATSTPSGIAGPEIGSSSAPTKAIGRSWPRADAAKSSSANRQALANVARQVMVSLGPVSMGDEGLEPPTPSV